MGDTPRYLSIGQGHDSPPYFPPTYEKPDCAYCEKRMECYSYGKFQRDRRDFTYTSGRCPRLPDMRGFVDQDEQELYAQTFPLIYAERDAAYINLSLSLPDAKRLMKVCRSYGCWWFWDGRDAAGYRIRRILTMEHSFQTKQEICDYMADKNWYHCIFRVDITDRYLW